MSLLSLSFLLLFITYYCLYIVWCDSIECNACYGMQWFGVHDKFPFRDNKAFHALP